MVIYQKIVIKPYQIIKIENKWTIKGKIETIIIIEEIEKMDFKERDHKKIKIEIFKIIGEEIIINIIMVIIK